MGTCQGYDQWKSEIDQTKRVILRGKGETKLAWNGVRGLSSELYGGLCLRIGGREAFGGREDHRLWLLVGRWMVV